ncbi:YgaP family membrane protein [Geoalkalibacter subterraneus]|uniref:Rhodanese n=1 Tax=Geoalkalibacter subterraneus TaxID=483547 RepID=A0A0B5FHP4_9BACT|nr:DUF2892 domain-containing protein [Geoalkalibacter subterraneus]AJF07712.1 rhodanese [Geoalkalibacter subterraneus]
MTHKVFSERGDRHDHDHQSTINRLLRLVAGAFVTLTALLAAVHSPHWLWLTAFVGLNLVQSAFTNWCPMMAILRRTGH